MADGVVLDPGVGGATCATDDCGAPGHVQLFKLAYSADGVATLVTADANGLEVQLGAALPAGAAEIGVVGLNAAALAALESITIGTALPAGTNNIGDVDVLTLPGVAGTVAHDAADSGNPVKVGGVARTADPTAVAASDRVDASHDILGKQLVLPYAAGDNLVQGVTAAITGTSDTAVVAAQGAGVRTYVTSLTVTNSHATVSTVVELKDGTTVIHRGYALAAGGGYTVTFPSPLRLTANTALNAANVTTGSNTYVSASGFKAAA